MRFASFLIALVLIGCGPGPKSARGEDKPKESYTAAVARFEATVAGFAETQGNTNSELEAIKEELKALKKQVADLNLLLTVDAEISVPVPKAVDAPPVEKAEQRLTFHGKPISVAEWLAIPLEKKQVVEVEVNNQKAGRTTVEKHLRWHGVEGDFSKLSRESLIHLHSVAHLKDDVPPMKAKPAPKVATVVQPYVQYRQPGGCPNGQCGRPQVYYYRR